jgi:hypothetical protein
MPGRRMHGRARQRRPKQLDCVPAGRTDRLGLCNNHAVPGCRRVFTNLEQRGALSERDSNDHPVHGGPIVWYSNDPLGVSRYPKWRSARSAPAAAARGLRPARQCRTVPPGTPGPTPTPEHHAAVIGWAARLMAGETSELRAEALGNRSGRPSVAERGSRTRSCQGARPREGHVPAGSPSRSVAAAAENHASRYRLPMRPFLT